MFRRQKNVSTIITFPIIDNDGDPVESAAGLDSEITYWSDESAPVAFTDCTNEATSVGSGVYYLQLSQSEMNFEYVYIRVKTSTSDAKTQHMIIETMVGDAANIATTDLCVTQTSMATINQSISAILEDTSDLASTLTTQTSLGTVNQSISAILDDTSAMNPMMATLATQASLGTVNQSISAILEDTSLMNGTLLTQTSMTTINDSISAIREDTSDMMSTLTTIQADTSAIGTLATQSDITILKGLAGMNMAMSYGYTGSANTTGTIHLYDSASNTTTHDKSTGLLDSLSFTGTYSGTLLLLAKGFE